MSERLGTIRKRLGLTQAQMGELLDTSREWVSRVENGAQPDHPKMLDLALSWLEHHHPPSPKWTRTMRTILLTAAATALLSACSSTPEPQLAATPSATDAFTAQCIGYGYIAGTPDVAQCAERLAQDVRTRAAKREGAARQAADAQFDRASGTVVE